jgi:copper transport protein
LIRSEPADNAILADPPPEIRLWFSEPIAAEFSSAQLLDINGQPVKLEKIRVDSNDPTLLILTPPELRPGLYSLRWNVLSETDGHFTQGPLVFGVGQTAISQARPTETKVTVRLPEVLLRWLNYGFLLVLAGSVAVTYLVLLPKSRSKESDPVAVIRRATRQRALALATFSAGLAVIIGLGLLAWQVVTLLETLPDEAALPAVTWRLLSQTRWGLLWLIRQGILLLLAGITYRLKRDLAVPKGQAGFGAALPGTILLLFGVLLTQSLTSHSAALRLNPALAIVIDTLHLLAASLWVGGLLALTVALFPLLAQESADFKQLVRVVWQPFSRVAAASVALLVATGLYSTGRHAASIDALLTTLYGQALLGKVGLMLAIGGIGLLNAFVLHPDLVGPLARLLRRPPGWTPLALPRLPRLVLAEAGLGLLVLLLAGLLTAGPTARGPEFEVDPEKIPTALNQTVDDMVLTFSAKPNRPGQNVFTLRAVSQRRPAPAEIIRVILRFTFLGQSMGQTSVDLVEVEPGLYQGGGNQFSLAGPWRVQAIVRRGGLEDTVADFAWTVAPAGQVRPVLISKGSLEAGLTIAAAVTMVMFLLGVALLWLVRSGELAKLSNYLEYRLKYWLRRSQAETNPSPSWGDVEPAAPTPQPVAQDGHDPS